MAVYVIRQIDIHERNRFIDRCKLIGKQPQEVVKAFIRDFGRPATDADVGMPQTTLREAQQLQEKTLRRLNKDHKRKV